jgi:hypothetical protein
MAMSGDDLDRQAEFIERRMGGPQIAEVLWGGPKGKGLIYVVGDLAKTVESLAGTVKELGKLLTSHSEKIDPLDAKVRIGVRLLWIIAGAGIPLLIALVARAVWISVTGSSDVKF